MSKIFSKHPSKIFYINIIADPHLKNDSSCVLVRDFCLRSCDDRYSFLSTQVSLVNKIICGDERNQKYFHPFRLEHFLKFCLQLLCRNCCDNIALYVSVKLANFMATEGGWHTTVHCPREGV